MDIGTTKSASGHCWAVYNIILKPCQQNGWFASQNHAQNVHFVTEAFLAVPISIAHGACVHAMVGNPLRVSDPHLKVHNLGSAEAIVYLLEGQQNVIRPKVRVFRGNSMPLWPFLGWFPPIVEFSYFLNARWILL